MLEGGNASVAAVKIVVMLILPRAL